MRQKKTGFGFQIGDSKSKSKSPKFEGTKKNPNFESRFPQIRIEIPNKNPIDQRPILKDLKTNKTHVSVSAKRSLIMNPQFEPHQSIRRSLSSSSSSSNRKGLICCSSSEALLATKSFALKVLKFTQVKFFLIKVPFRVFILLFLPSVYYFSLSFRSFYLYVLFVIAFCCVLLSSLNITSFHGTNLPSFRLFVSRNFPSLKLYKSDDVSKSNPQVVWSIGSKARFEEDSNSGFLVKVYSNGDVYEGEFYKGKCSGSGVYYYNLNGRYEGDWVDQKYDGFGVETWAKGSRYRGQYRQGLRHGYGVYRFYTGDMYAGEWFKGQCHGCGVHTCEDGSKYSGEFKGGIKHGLGHYHFRNGDTYAGEYFADKMHGFGVYRFANGHRYEGAWHEGRRQGCGMYTFRNGDTQSGYWDNGVLTISTSQDTSQAGSSSTTISHAKVLKSVQEARRIVEKAVAVADTDERVNRAVTAANRAANAARVAAVKAVQNRMHDVIDDRPLEIV